MLLEPLLIGPDETAQTLERCRRFVDKDAEVVLLQRPASDQHDDWGIYENHGSPRFSGGAKAGKSGLRLFRSHWE